MKSTAFVLDRASASRNAQSEIASQWVWGEKTVLQWDSDIAAVKGAQLDELDARVSLLANTEEWDAQLANVEETTRKLLRLAKTHFRNDSVKLAMFQDITFTRGSRERIYSVGRQVWEVWDNVDSAWTPITGLDVGGFGSMLSNVDAKKGLNDRLYTTWRRNVLELQRKVDLLDDANVAWYSDATTRFAEGTLEGDLVRSTVPTTSDPVEPVGPATISGLIANNGTIHFDVTAEHATRFTVFHRSPGAPQYVVLVSDSPESATTLDNQAPGVHWFKAFGTNSDGSSAESQPVSVQLAAVAAAA